MRELKRSLLTKVVLAISLPFLTLGFGPIAPSRQTSRNSNTRVNMLIPQHVVVPSANAATTWNPAKEASFSALISTMYSQELKPDGVKSIRPLEIESALGSRGGGTAISGDQVSTSTSTSTSGAQDRLLKMEANGAAVLDPRVISKYDDAFPGFKVTHGVLPASSHAKLLDGEGESTRTFARDVMEASYTTHVLSRLPLVAILAVLVDFFFVQPGVEIYREDLEENETEVIKAGVKGNAVRLGVLVVLSAATIFATDIFG